MASKHVCIPQHILVVLPKNLPRACDQFISVIKIPQSQVFWKIAEPSFVTALEYDHQHRVTWYFVSKSFIVLCTSNFCKILCWHCNNNYMCCWVILIIESYLNNTWVAKSLICITQKSTIFIVRYCNCSHAMKLYFYPSNAKIQAKDIIYIRNGFEGNKIGIDFGHKFNYFSPMIHK